MKQLKLTYIENKTVELDQKIEEMQHSIPTNVLKPEEIIAKINDLNLNLMIYYLPESSSLSVNARVESDKTEFMKIINIFTPG